MLASAYPPPPISLSQGRSGTPSGKLEFFLFPFSLFLDDHRPLTGKVPRTVSTDTTLTNITYNQLGAEAYGGWHEEIVATCGNMYCSQNGKCLVASSLTLFQDRKVFYEGCQPLFQEWQPTTLSASSRHKKAIDKMARNNEWLYDLGGQKQGNAIMLMAHQSFVQVM